MRGKITKKLLQQKFLPAKFCYLCLRLISSRCILQNARPKLSRKKNRLHRARARYAIFFPKSLSTLHLYSYSSGRKAFADERFGLQTRHSTPSQPFIAGAKPATRDLLPAQAANAITWDNIRAHLRHFSLSPSKFFLSCWYFSLSAWKFFTIL